MRDVDRWREHLSGRAGLVIGGLVMVAGLVALTLTGGQTSAVLQTVGSGVPPRGGTVTGDGAESAVEDGAAQVADAPGVAAVLDVTRPDLLVIRTGDMELRVSDVQDAVDAAARQVVAVGGYVATSTQSSSGADPGASVTYRIPAEAWDRFVADLGALADDVLTSETRTEDVTATVVDLAARIANLRTTEGALQSIMTSAASVKDVLAVQSELTDVRGQIEEAVARQDHLKDQAAFSTLAVHFALPPVPAVDTAQRHFDPAAEVDRSVAQLVRIGQRLLGFGIWFAIVGLPILVAIGVAVALAFLGRRRVMAMRSRPVT